MKRFLRLAAPLGVIIGLCLLAWLLLRDTDIAVLNPAGSVAIEQKNLLLFTLFLSAIVVVPVFTLLGFFAVRYRASNTSAPYQPDWSENKHLEMLWWGIPIVIIGILAIVTWQTSHSLDPYRSLGPERPMTVQVVALQWKWLFIYPELGIATLNHVPMQLNQPVKFQLTANAPMSSFWIPALGSQIYAMNGMSSTLNLKAIKTGEYVGYTTNINGEGYAGMTFTAEVMNERDFKKWASKAAESPQTLSMNSYTVLTAPKVVKDKKTYSLKDDSIYDRIVHSGMGHAAQSSSHGDSHE